jgi:hypothetical protein
MASRMTTCVCWWSLPNPWHERSMTTGSTRKYLPYVYIIVQKDGTRLCNFEPLGFESSTSPTWKRRDSNFRTSSISPVFNCWLVWIFESFWLNFQVSPRAGEAADPQRGLRHPPTTQGRTWAHVDFSNIWIVCGYLLGLE